MTSDAITWQPQASAQIVSGQKWLPHGVHDTWPRQYVYGGGIIHVTARSLGPDHFLDSGIQEQTIHDLHSDTVASCYEFDGLDEPLTWKVTGRRCSGFQFALSWGDSSVRILCWSCTGRTCAGRIIGGRGCAGHMVSGRACAPQMGSRRIWPSCSLTFEKSNVSLDHLTFRLQIQLLFCLADSEETHVHHPAIFSKHQGR